MISASAGLETKQFSEGCPAEYGINGDAYIALEIGQGLSRLVAKDPVDPASVEAQAAKVSLQVCHIVTSDHGYSPVQQSLAQLLAGLY